MVRKQLVDFAKPALLRERRVIEVVRLYAEVRGDMIPDHLQPLELFGGEAGRAFLLRESGFEVGGDALGEGYKLVLLVHGIAYQRDEVGEDAALACALDIALVERRISLPELRFGPEVRRGLDLLGQRLDVFIPERRPVGRL
jgi:hypothetical protein